ncbi:unnamed protein product, partial [Prorocentrum cordatum]
MVTLAPVFQKGRGRANGDQRTRTLANGDLASRGRPTVTGEHGRWLALLAGVFFTGMTLMEIVLEGATRRFSHAETVGLLLTLAQFSGCTVLAVLGGGASGAVQGPAAPEGPAAAARGWLPFVGLSCLVWCGTGLANVAVSWVQYPVKVVFKSSKLIPTMGVSVLMGNSRTFGALDYLAAVLLCAGAAGFSFHAGKIGESSQLVLLGIALLTCTMFCDAVSANAQQRLMQRTGVPPMVMMLRLNLCGVLVQRDWNHPLALRWFTRFSDWGKRVV